MRITNCKIKLEIKRRDENHKQIVNVYFEVDCQRLFWNVPLCTWTWSLPNANSHSPLSLSRKNYLESDNPVSTQYSLAPHEISSMHEIANNFLLKPTKHVEKRWKRVENADSHSLRPSVCEFAAIVIALWQGFQCTDRHRWFHCSTTFACVTKSCTNDVFTTAFRLFSQTHGKQTNAHFKEISRSQCCPNLPFNSLCCGRVRCIDTVAGS